ncbi:gamma-parvin isoform X2 [Eleutherodactylus coqui]|uniref:gamma-parvin isoform X2 n=1 Tax=Eleutherodactylus coqui TaxID=57060 RepID=UPI00346249E9
MDLIIQSGDSQQASLDGATTGEVRKILQPNSENDAKLQELKTFLIDWINNELQKEHIVVKSLEEDLFDGLILHHLLQKVSDLKIEVEEITLTAINQKRKLGVILKTVSSCLQLEESQPWDVNSIHNKDLLATLHLLVALAQHFRPRLPLPQNVSVEVIVVEPTKTGMKTGKAIEFITRSRADDDACHKDGFDHLFELTPDKVDDVKQAMLNFVNKQLFNLSLTVTDLDSQVHNVSLALDFLLDEGILQNPVDPTEIVNGDIKPTLRVLYSLFLRHKKASKPS